MKARRDTIARAIERTMREHDDPQHITGISAGQGWTLAEMRRDARQRLTTLRALEGGR